MYRASLKRLFDIVLAILLLPFFLPCIALIAILVKLDSEGPVFFRQERCGFKSRYFTMLKFRSMAVDKEAEKKGFEPGSKRRVTFTGKILRKTKLDELPQIFNVLKGDMSFVGPRPEVRPFIAYYPERWAAILEATRPGITDPASIVFRNEEEILAASKDPDREYREVVVPRKLELYEKYTANINFFSDISIIIRTAIAVIKH